jgi:hypothetical protein
VVDLEPTGWRFQKTTYSILLFSFFPTSTSNHLCHRVPLAGGTRRVCERSVAVAELLRVTLLNSEKSPEPGVWEKDEARGNKMTHPQNRSHYHPQRPYVRSRSWFLFLYPLPLPLPLPLPAGPPRRSCKKPPVTSPFSSDSVFSDLSCPVLIFKWGCCSWILWPGRRGYIVYACSNTNSGICVTNRYYLHSHTVLLFQTA